MSCNTDNQRKNSINFLLDTEANDTTNTTFNSYSNGSTQNNQTRLNEPEVVWKYDQPNKKQKLDSVRDYESINKKHKSSHHNSDDDTHTSGSDGSETETSDRENYNAAKQTKESVKPVLMPQQKQTQTLPSLSQSHHYGYPPEAYYYQQPKMMGGPHMMPMPNPMVPYYPPVPQQPRSPPRTASAASSQPNGYPSLPPSMSNMMPYLNLPQAPPARTNEEILHWWLMNIRAQTYCYILNEARTESDKKFRCVFSNTCDKRIKGKGNLRRHIEWHLRRIEEEWKSSNTFNSGGINIAPPLPTGPSYGHPVAPPPVTGMPMVSPVQSPDHRKAYEYAAMMAHSQVPPSPSFGQQSGSSAFSLVRPVAEPYRPRTDN